MLVSRIIYYMYISVIYWSVITVVLSTRVGSTGISCYILYFSDILECNNFGII